MHSLIVKLGSGRKKEKGKTEEKLARDHPRRPARIGADVERFSRRGRRQLCMGSTKVRSKVR